jgi:hypothetical protein
MGEMRKCVQNFGGEKTGGRSPLGRPGHKWEDIIRTDLREM